MSQRYFLTAESTYEDLRLALNTELQYPNTLGKSVFQTALYAPRDNFRRVLLAVDTDLPGYATVSDAIAPLLASDAMEEIDEATYLAAVSTAGAALTFSQVADSATYVNFLTTPGGGDLAAALSGIDSAISGKATSSHSHGNIASDGKVTAAGNISQSHSIVIADADGDLTVVSQVSAQDIATVNGGSNTSLYNDIQDLTVAVLGLPTTYASLSHTHSASDITSGTLSDSRLSTNAQAAINLYLWSSFR